MIEFESKNNRKWRERFDFLEKYETCLGYVPISSSAPRVEQEQRPSGNGDREAIVVGAGCCDGEGERANIAYAPRYIFAFRTHIRS